MATRGVDHTRRYYIRQSDPTLGFMPWGCLPLVGLLGTFAVGLGMAFSTIPNDVHDTARTSLDAAGMSWAQVAVDGQDVHLTGTEPTAGAGDKAIALVEGAKRSTWLFPSPPRWNVTGDFKAAAPPKPAAPAARLGDWNWMRNAEGLVLTGLVPTEGVKSAIVAAAKKAVPNVVDKLKVQGVAMPDGYQAMALRGIEVVSPCLSGHSEFTGGAYSTTCLIPKDQADAIEAKARATPTYGAIGTVEMLSPEAVAKCEEVFKNLLTESKIQFDTGSAHINAKSNALLDSIATEAKACPGTLRIEGHTDSQGADAFNLNLSQKRAEATRTALMERGVDAGHLKAKGYGETRPIGSNDTPEGMAQNRRIEIHVSL